ncbi:hypothetical protein [Galbibacter pacificus]|uniref:Immunity protein 22 of polymorphic toxin system n=1 Tax=Galbibacter pacificus TaxID=2996052 RepID=A0ABT6FR68_9FLAO|nr:hypothetical protein [Galbibacter pacificus]MDG3581759.1 hypothetical protein [Galbibacter pacificus]MDG3585767.1 hypothetical protein [Galbibacter pacificus]
MYDLLKNIAQINNWEFIYGRQDYQNVEDMYNEIDDNKVNLFLDSVVIDTSFSESGVESNTYSGRFLLLLSSDVDELYDGDESSKYQSYIKPLIDNHLTKIKTILSCGDYAINTFRTTEVINLFDGNYDGIIVNYNVSEI